MTTVCKNNAMKVFLSVALSLVLGQCQGLDGEEFDFTNLTSFPKNFIWSVATASYQVEGAWNESGKGENIWDRITHTRPDWVADKRNGDVACDSYHKFKEDVQNLRDIGFSMYRFSLSWSRLFPSGYTNVTNPDGVRYYSQLIDELRANGIQPFVTIYHWDLPQPLEDIGGWLNPEIAYIFADYAKAVFTLFGEKVKWWATINEPISVTEGYGYEGYAPSLHLHGTGEYLAGHNLLRAHAKAYRIYQKTFKPTQGGKVSMVCNGGFSFPKNSSDPSHVEAAERANQFTFGWFLNPIYGKTGDYPPIMRELVDKNSKAEGRSQSRLPHFTQEEIEELKGSYDYMGLNHYSSHLAEPGATGEDPSVYRDQHVITSYIRSAPKSNCNWQQVIPQVIPEGFRALVNWMKTAYDDPQILITENGFCDVDKINDYERINYIQPTTDPITKSFLSAPLGHKRIIYSKFQLPTTYGSGDMTISQKKFGLMRVDFDSPDRTRTMKLSGKFMKELIQKNKENNEI